jgi:hypothetical protein
MGGGGGGGGYSGGNGGTGGSNLGSSGGGGGTSCFAAELTDVLSTPASNSGNGYAVLQIVPVPEPSGFLATSLLLGAAGLIRRRQARAA